MIHERSVNSPECTTNAQCPMTNATGDIRHPVALAVGTHLRHWWICATCPRVSLCRSAPGRKFGGVCRSPGWPPLGPRAFSSRTGSSRLRRDSGPAPAGPRARCLRGDPVALAFSGSMCSSSSFRASGLSVRAETSLSQAQRSRRNDGRIITSPDRDRIQRSRKGPEAVRNP
jgi:hypothetical protein